MAECKTILSLALFISGEFYLSYLSFYSNFFCSIVSLQERSQKSVKICIENEKSSDNKNKPPLIKKISWQIAADAVIVSCRGPHHMYSHIDNKKNIL